ncbi:MAG TPA: fucose isomerase [Candidatus Acetothermia bacterium]|nr:fucose isomerase [Candidatus Acetothermia bacterium]
MKGEGRTPVLGLLVGNRGFFPDALVEEGRRRMLSVLEEAGVKVVALSTEDTKYGAVETREDAEKCARLFRSRAEELDGIIVSLPNFGDERAAADALRLAGLDLPILVQAFPDELGKLDPAHRRDAFCGKLSLCNNLVQYGIPFSDTALHVEAPESREFKEDLERFLAICRVVKGLKNARLGAVGARPAAFNTVRFSEKILERHGISVETIDLSEIISRAQALDSNSREVSRELSRIKETFHPQGIPVGALDKMARLSVVLKQWIEKNEIDALALQCWTAIESLYGIVPCAVMSLLSEAGIPSACETDVMGALSMYVLQLAAASPAALMDWNNNFGDDPDKVILFHCSNLPCSFFESCGMSYQNIIAGTVGKENTYGTVVGRVTPGPATFLRLSTFDTEGVIAGVVAEGRFTEDRVDTFGGYGVAEIPRLRELLRLITQNGFEHHVAVTKAHVGQAVQEALETYLGWRIVRS